MILTIISTIVMVIIVFLIWNSLNENRFSWKDKRTWLFILLTTIATVINYFVTYSLIKIINMTLIFIIIYKFLYKIELKKSIAVPVITEVLYVISEIIFSIILIVILKDNVEELVNNYGHAFITNVVISIMVLLITHIKIIRKLFFVFDNLICRLDELSIIALSILSISIYNIFMINIYNGMKPEILIAIMLLIFIIMFTLVCLFFKVKNDYYKINDKYNSSLESLKELENALTNHRIDNHENKNQLMTIRNMTTSKKIIKFIDTILDNKIKDDKNISKETDIIPSGGLRGLVYSKLLVMNNKGIEYELDVANSVRIVDLLDYGNETMLDICKIIGIFLDNAIEEVETLEEKYIVIEMYLEEDVFNITITNIFDNTKNKDNIYKAGVSTKGGNHGYGLSLVKKLVHKNKQLKTFNEISEDEFTQILKIYK